MTPSIETAALTAKAAWSFGTAGVSAVCAIGSRIFADALPPGSERLLDLGFAGIFIAALLYGMRVQWQQRLADQAKADAREEKLIALVNEKEKRMNDLEKEFRDGLRGDLQRANEGRAELIQAIKDTTKKE